MALNMRTGKLADIAGLDHVNIRTNDVAACRRFYVDSLGFEEGYRPDFDVPGIWLYLDGAPVVHIIETSEPVENSSGSIDHIAFRAHHFDKFTARLKAGGIDYEDHEIPGMDLHQLFCFDPHGIKVEFNFEGQDRPWTTIEKEHQELRDAASGAVAVRRPVRKKKSGKQAGGKTVRKAGRKSAGKAAGKSVGKAGRTVAKTATRKKASTGGRISILKGKRVVSVTRRNPRRNGSLAAKSLQIIIDAGGRGIRYEKYLERGGRNRDVHWDIAHGHVRVV